MYGNSVEEIIKGTKYEYHASLGKGGFANVYRVTDLHLGKDYAMKIMERNGSVENCNEVKWLKELNHDGLPGLHDVFCSEDFVCIVMELIEGESLEQYVCNKGKLSIKETLEFGNQISHILSYLHTRQVPVIHGDIKPANLMVCEGRIRLIDFGTALLQYEKRNVLYGTLGYASPEQRKGELWKQSDIYAFGKVLLFMLTGRDAKLFEEQISDALLKRYGIPKRLRRILLCCIHKEVLKRYQSGKELEEAFAKVKGNSRYIPGQCMSWVSLILKTLGMGNLLYILVCEEQKMNQQLLFAGWVGIVWFACLLESFSTHFYKRTILECECSLLVTQGWKCENASCKYD